MQYSFLSNWEWVPIAQLETTHLQKNSILLPIELSLHQLSSLCLPTQRTFCLTIRLLLWHFISYLLFVERWSFRYHIQNWSTRTYHKNGHNSEYGSKPNYLCISLECTIRRSWNCRSLQLHGEILISSVFFPTVSSSDLHHEVNFLPPGQGVLQTRSPGSPVSGMKQ